MAYQVFARKYRPQTFAEVIGQEPVVRTLTNALRLGRIAQAYLFVGPRGTGKTSTARILAKALECSNGPSAEFDPKEEICMEIAEGRSLDVLEIDGASNNGVEQVRDLRDNVRYAPAKGRYKIYIIDEVHMLSGAAFNALLKTLEEPPAHIKFIFATTEVHKLPATILSRCQRFDLRRIPEPLIRAHLAHICGLEKVEAEPAALDALARYAEGGMRDAESALDQAISFYGDRVSEADVLSLFGLTGFAPVAQLGRALAEGDVGAVLKSARELAAAGKDLGKLSQDLLGFFRNIVIYQVSPMALEGDISAAEKAVLSEISPKISRNAALGILEELSHLESRLRYALAKDVVFEVALIQMSQLKEKVSLESILESLGGAGPALPPPAGKLAAATPTRSAPVETRPPTDKPMPVVSVPEPAVKTPEVGTVSGGEGTPDASWIDVPSTGATADAPVVGTPTPSANALAQQAWKNTVEIFAAERPLEADTIRAVQFLTCKADVLEVMLPTALAKKIPYLRSPRNLELLQQSLAEQMGRTLSLAFIVGDGRKASDATPLTNAGGNAISGKPAPPPPDKTQDWFLNDEVIQNAVKLFEAKILAPSRA
jgi:DNA polymerase-3 subunit gamma/tau